MKRISLHAKKRISLQAKVKSDNEENDIIGDLIIGTILRQKKNYLDHYYYGPWKLYIPTACKDLLNKLFHPYSFNDKYIITIMERIKKIYGIKEIIISNEIDNRNIALVHIDDIIMNEETISVNNKKEYWSYWQNIIK